MPRTKIDLPQTFLFQTSLDIRIGDINYGGHLGNDSALSLIHEARVRFFRSMGYTELDIEGIGIVLADAVLNFKSEGFAGEMLQIDIAIDGFTTVGFDMYYRVGLKSDHRIVFTAKTTIVFFDYKTRKKAAIPERLLNRLQNRPTEE